MSKENPTLILLTPGFPASEADTNCLPMQQHFVRTFKEMYPDIRIVVLSFQYPYFKKTYQWFDTTVISFNGKNKGGIARLLLRREINGVLKQLITNNKTIGLLSFWLGECALVGSSFARKNNMLHYSWLMGQDAAPGNKYVKKIKPLAGEVVALSNSLQEAFEKNHGVKPLHLVPPGINLLHFTSVTKEKDIDILGAGSLIALKQFDVFIDIVAAVKKTFPNIKAVLAGNGSEMDKLKSLTEEKGLKENLTLTGELPYGEMIELMKRSKILLHPSSYEGFSGVCMEALYCGAHVISFCRAMKQEIPHWHIVQTKEEMKEKTLHLLADNSLSAESIFPFTMQDTVKKILALFDKQALTDTV